jgi:hypothetical protein
MLAPRWAQITRSVAIQYDPTPLIIEALERLHQRGINPATIDAVAREASRTNPSPSKCSSPNPGAKTSSLPTAKSTNQCLRVRPCINPAFTSNSNTTSVTSAISPRVGLTRNLKYCRILGSSSSQYESRGQS